jgi:hypothetical protein
MRTSASLAAVVAATIAFAIDTPLLATQPRPATPSAPATAPAARPPATATAPSAPAGQAARPAATAAAPAGTQQQTISRSDFELVVTLLRNTLTALHHANITGNYTVFRDLAAPGFRDVNTATRLSEIFAPIRSRGIDLGRVVLLEPNLTVAKINENGMLNVAGTLAVAPVPVNFEMLYQGVNNAWQLFGISIVPEAPQAALAPQAAPAAPASAPPRPAAVPTPTPRP